MSKDEKDAAEAPKKKSKKMLMIIVIAVVLLGGGGGAAFFLLSGGKAQATVKTPTKGIVAPMDTALTINLANGHYLKLAFTVQETADAGATAIDLAEALDIAIEQYTGKDIAELSTEAGRTKNKDELLAKIEKAYNLNGKQVVMDLYLTQFVTQ